MNKWLRVLRHLELLPRPMGQDWSEIWLQKFSGTITIWPKTVFSDFIHILSDPDPERLRRMLRMGQISAFPKIQFIKNRLHIETAIARGLDQFAPPGEVRPSLRYRPRPGAPPQSAVADGDTDSSLEMEKPRRGSFLQEMQRQSAVFFDDTDLTGED